MTMKKLLTAFVGMILVAQVSAAPLDFWGTEGWVQVDDDEGVARNGFVDPGWGGQDFDAEYLYYRVEGSTLHLGIQAGYDLVDGHVSASGRDYYAGDLALSFGGDFDYALDFGLLTKDYDLDLVDAGSGTGVDAAGLYSGVTWNNDIYFDESAPFAMTEGSLVGGALIGTSADYVASADSYFRTASIDLNVLGLTEGFDLGMHWTMSCGNDVVEGVTSVSVPEPKTLMLFAIGFAGLMMRRKFADA